MVFNAVRTGDPLRERESLDMEGRPKIEPLGYISIERLIEVEEAVKKSDIGGEKQECSILKYK